MARIKDKREQQIRCNGCGQNVASYDIITSGLPEASYRQLCTQCFNEEVANALGLVGFAHATLESVKLTDSGGLAHEFYFRTRLFGCGMALDAFELRNGQPAGYEFQIIGDAEDDLFILVRRLIEKIRRALATKHVMDGTLGRQIADHRVVRGRVGWDDAHHGSVPLLIIDGEEITWNELGSMLMSYEGWQFKLSLHDKSDEV